MGLPDRVDQRVPLFLDEVQLEYIERRLVRAPRARAERRLHPLLLVPLQQLAEPHVRNARGLGVLHADGLERELVVLPTPNLLRLLLRGYRPGPLPPSRSIVEPNPPHLPTPLDAVPILLLVLLGFAVGRDSGLGCP